MGEGFETFLKNTHPPPSMLGLKPCLPTAPLVMVMAQDLILIPHLPPTLTTL